MSRWSSQDTKAAGPSPEGYDLTTATGRLEYLKELLKDVPAAAKTRIVESIAEAANQMGSGVGPSPPRTEEEIEERLLVMFEGLPRRAVKRAVKRAFGKPRKSDPEYGDEEAEDGEE